MLDVENLQTIWCQILYLYKYYYCIMFLFFKIKQGLNWNKSNDRIGYFTSNKIPQTGPYRLTVFKPLSWVQIPLGQIVRMLTETQYSYINTDKTHWDIVYYTASWRWSFILLLNIFFHSPQYQINAMTILKIFGQAWFTSDLTILFH